jgi:hypothetical protein
MHGTIKGSNGGGYQFSLSSKEVNGMRGGEGEILPIVDTIREAETTQMVKSVLAIGHRPSRKNR